MKRNRDHGNRDVGSVVIESNYGGGKSRGGQVRGVRSREKFLCLT